MWRPTAGGSLKPCAGGGGLQEEVSVAPAGLGEGSAHNPLETVSLRFLPVCQEGCPLTQEDGQ